MLSLLKWLRPLLLIVGLALLFIAERYLGAESYHLTLQIGSVALVALSFLLTLVQARLAKAQGFQEEARGWRIVAIWQAALLAASVAYLIYGKSLNGAPTPESFLQKALLALWLLLFVLGGSGALGSEWGQRTSGLGVNAEPGRVRRASLSCLSIGILFSFLVCLNYIGDKKDVQRDWSYLKVRTPSESTRKLTKTLTSDLTVALFYPQGNEVRGVIADYFSALAASDPHIKLEWYDKDMAPAKAEEYRVSRNGQIVLDMKGKKSRIDTGTQLSKAKKTLKELDSEVQKAFLETTSDRKTIYFTRGHGEFSWVGESGDNPLRSLKLLEGFLRQQNYSTRLFGVAEGSATQVPDDASAVAIIGPVEPFQKEEIEALKAYMGRGGNLLVFLDIEKNSAPNATIKDQTQEAMLTDFLASMGLKFNAVPLANEKNHVAATRSDSDKWFIYTNVFTSHDSVISLARHDERVGVLAFQSGYFSVTPELGRWRAFEAVRSLSDTFADANRNFRFDEGEKRDAYVMGAVAELKDKKPADPNKKDKRQGRLVAFADATAISDLLIRNPGNALYFVDSLKWLVGESELQGELANEEDVKIRHTRKEDVVWFHGTVIVVPLLVLSAGFFATRRRQSPSKKKVSTDAA